MARSKSEQQEPQEVEVQEGPVLESSTGGAEWAVNEHVKALVALFVGQELQAFEQRLNDLEMLVGQPKGAVEFSQPPVSDIPEFTRKSSLDDVPWFGG